MSQWTSEQRGALGPSNTEATLFSRTMALVAITVGVFAGAAYLGRSLSSGAGLLFFVAAFVCLLVMRVAARRAPGSAFGLLLLFGLLMGLASAPTLAYYASVDPSAIGEAAAATALFMLALGSFGYVTNRDLSAVGRLGFFALFALILFGIILIFVHIPHGQVLYSVLGLVIFAALTAFDFQRLRRRLDVDSAPFLAASIFLDIINVFFLFLNLTGRRD